MRRLLNGRMGTGIAALVASIAVAAAPAQAAHHAKKHKTSHPAVPTVHLYISDAYFLNGQPVTVPTRILHFGGTVAPYVDGQRVTVKAYENGRQIMSGLFRLSRSLNGRYGTFRAYIIAPEAGNVTVYVRHQRNSKLMGFLVNRGYQALDENVTWGSTGLFVQLMQQRLAAVHIYIPQTGVYDQGMGLALDAYHRLLRWGVYQDLDGRTISFLLDGFGAFPVRFPNQGRHAEGNLGLQLLALIDGGNVQYIYPISSGKPSTPTILGSFQIYRRVPYFRPDGMYFSSYFYSGYAIHGYNPAPDYPASHGCMRLPMTDAIFVYNWLDYGLWVDTYY